MEYHVKIIIGNDTSFNKYLLFPLPANTRSWGTNIEDAYVNELKDN